MADEFYREEIIFDVNDDEAIRRAKRAEDRIKKTFERTQRRAKALGRMRAKPIIMARDRMTKQVTKADRMIRRLDSKKASPIITAKDEATRVIKKTDKLLTSMSKKDVEVTTKMKGDLLKDISKTRKVIKEIDTARIGPRARLKGNIVKELKRTEALVRTVGMLRSYPKVTLKDRVTATLKRVQSGLRKVSSKSWEIVIAAKNKTFAVFRAIRGQLTSLKGMATIAISFIGLNKLNQATTGAAMQFEEYEVAMGHWLDGNMKKANKLIDWMGRFADKTPFNSDDLFPALTRGVGITDSVDQAKDLLKISTDMAALTPGKTVNDAMEALADAQMGEFERMKEFQVKMTKEQYDAIGGWAGFIDVVQKRVKGGAEKLSDTASGMISTIQGYAKTYFRSLGEGILTSLKPRLESISKWIDNNQDKWNEWKETIRKAGEQASEWAFEKLEKGFNYIRENYLENEDFKKLDFAGKVSFVIGDFTDKLTEWVESDGAKAVAKAGADLGVGIITAMAKAMGKEILEDPITAFLLGGIIGLKTPGPPTVKLVVALAIAATPWVKKTLDFIRGHSPYITDEKVKEYNDTMSGKSTPKHGYGGSNAKIDEAPEKGFWGSTWDNIKGGFNSVRKAVRGYATGGFINQEHLAMVGEGNRPEVVIPLGSEKRDRAMDLWHKAGEIMGITPFANGGIVNATPSGAVVQASMSINQVSASGIDKEANSYGEKFSESVADGINGSVIYLDSWKKRNIHQPMQGIVKEAVGFGSDTTTAFATGMKSQEAKVKETSKYLAEQVEKTFKKELGIHSPSRVMAELGQFASLGIVKGLDSVDIKGFAEKQAGSLAAAFSGMGSIGGNVSEWIKAAMMVTGVPDSWLGPLSVIAQKESGGNPLAQNNWDINAARGTPSKGLMQTIGPTFEAYKGNGMNNILNPIHNAVAAINYIKSRYGTVFNTPGIQSMMHGGPYKGYFRGTPGPLSQDQTAWVGERGPELLKLPRGSEVIPNHQSRGYNAPEYQAPEPNYDNGGSGGDVHLHFDMDGMVGQILVENKEEIDGKVDEVADTFAKKLKAIIENLS